MYATDGSMATILQHAALGFAMGAGSFVLAALPSHGTDARVGEPASPAAPAPLATSAKPAAIAPPIDVTAPARESTGLRRLRARPLDMEDAAPERGRARDEFEPAAASPSEDDEDASSSSCRMRDHRARRWRMTAGTSRMHDPQPFAR